MSILNLKKDTRILLAYALAISLLFTFALQHDSQIADTYEHSRYGWSDTGFPLIVIFAITLGVYLIRVLLINAPRYFKKRFSKGWEWGGIIASVIPEIYLIFVALALNTEDVGSCDGGGDFSSCGWGFLSFLIIAASCLAQILGMTVGGLVEWAKNGKGK
jgi:hypothetical protein